MRWHAHHHTTGTGHLYQGRFKAFPVQSDEHLFTVLRYVERNAVRANLVEARRGLDVVKRLAGAHTATPRPNPCFPPGRSTRRTTGSPG